MIQISLSTIPSIYNQICFQKYVKKKFEVQIEKKSKSDEVVQFAIFFFLINYCIYRKKQMSLNISIMKY